LEFGEEFFLGLDAMGAVDFDAAVVDDVLGGIEGADDFAGAEAGEEEGLDLVVVGVEELCTEEYIRARRGE
jgi:hypothetical protein